MPSNIEVEQAVLGALLLSKEKYPEVDALINSSDFESDLHKEIYDCIKELGIGRRRIYDIINIVESFGMVKRLRKNEYSIKCPLHIKNIVEDIEVSVDRLIVELVDEFRR